MNDKVKKELEAAVIYCAAKAQATSDAINAMQYTQAALNASTALIGLDRLDRELPSE